MTLDRMYMMSQNTYVTQGKGVAVVNAESVGRCR